MEPGVTIWELLRLVDLTPGRLRNYLWFLASAQPSLWGPETRRERFGEQAEDVWRSYGPSGPVSDDIPDPVNST